MAELEDRMQREAKLAALLSRVGANQRRELEKLLGNPPDIRNVPETWWDDSQKEIEEVLIALLLLTFAASAFAHGLDKVRAAARAEAWATRTGARIAKEMVRNTRTGLRVSLRGIVVGGMPVGLADLRQVTVRWLGPARWSNVATTETTRAQHFGSEYGVEETVGLSKDDYWVTSGDAKVCPVCAPLNGTTRPVWSRKFPGGPPEPHVNCRCYISYVGAAVKASR